MTGKKVAVLNRSMESQPYFFW